MLANGRPCRLWNLRDLGPYFNPAIGACRAVILPARRNARRYVGVTHGWSGLRLISRPLIGRLRLGHRLVWLPLLIRCRAIGLPLLIRRRAIGLPLIIRC